MVCMGANQEHMHVNLLQDVKLERFIVTNDWTTPGLLRQI